MIDIKRRGFLFGAAAVAAAVPARKFFLIPPQTIRPWRELGIVSHPRLDCGPGVFAIVRSIERGENHYDASMLVDTTRVSIDEARSRLLAFDMTRVLASRPTYAVP